MPRGRPTTCPATARGGRRWWPAPTWPSSRSRLSGRRPAHFAGSGRRAAGPAPHQAGHHRDGGKNAIIIDDDADLDEAVAGVLHSVITRARSARPRIIVLTSTTPSWSVSWRRRVSSSGLVGTGDVRQPRHRAGGPGAHRATSSWAEGRQAGARQEPPERAKALGGYHVPLAIFEDAADAPGGDLRPSAVGHAGQGLRQALDIANDSDSTS